jgi:hypothetical protein
MFQEFALSASQVAPSPDLSSIDDMALKRTAAEMAAEPRIIGWDGLDEALLEVVQLKEKRAAAEESPEEKSSNLGVNYDGERLVMDATPQRETWLSAPFGFERNGHFVKQTMTICGGDGKGHKHEPLDIRVQTPPELHEKLAQVEAVVKLKLEPYGAFEWVSALTPASVRVKVIAKATTDETNFKLKPVGGAVMAGRGVEWLKPILDANHDFNFCEVKFTAVLSLWTRGKKAGVNWTARVFAAKQTQAIVPTQWPDVYPDDVFEM